MDYGDCQRWKDKRGGEEGMKGNTVHNVGSIIRRDETDEAVCDIRFKGIETYYHYTSLKDLIKEWRDYDEYMENEVKVLEKPKSEARRQIDLFLRRIKNIPTDPSGFDRWKNSI